MTSLVLLLLGAALPVLVVWIRQRHLSFAGQMPADYEGLAPEFDLTRHLGGPVLCEGVIFGPTGRVASRFVADMEGHWDANGGRLVQRFRFDSGATQEREWRLTLSPGGAFRAEADDVEGAGVGRQCGPAVRLAYRIRLPEDAGGHVLDTTDWMYLVEDGTILNRSQFRKYGVLVAELIATMRPRED